MSYSCNCPGLGAVECYHPCGNGCCPGGTPVEELVRGGSGTKGGVATESFRGVPSVGSTNYGTRGQKQSFASDTDPTDDTGFRNFMDSNFLEDGTMPDSDKWSNHPGFLGGTWWKDTWFPRKAEAERYDSALASKKKKYPLNDDLGCDGLDDTIGVIDKAITRNANSGAKSRVIQRESRALENRRLDFKNEWDNQDCSQQRLDAQAAEFDTNIQKMFNEASAKSLARKTEDNTLTNVALGVGALVIGVVTYMALKK
jgi:hypothetical protein